MSRNFIISRARRADDRLLVLGAGSVRWIHYLKYAVELDDLDLAKTSQIWERIPHPSDGNAFALKNIGRSGWLYLQVQNNAIVSMNGDTQAMTWALLEDRPPETSHANGSYWYNDNVAGPYNALASRDDWEQKLNIRGNGPYARGYPIIAFPWDGGAANELWRFWPATGVPRPGSRVLLTNFEHLTQIGATPDRGVYMHANKLGWETWSIEDAGGGQVYLRSAHGTYLGSRQNGEVYVTPNRDAWERWVLTTDDAVRLRSAQWGLNLGSRPDGSIYTHTNRAQWERWWGTVV